jgi:hypothetical protein
MGLSGRCTIRLQPIYQEGFESGSGLAVGFGAGFFGIGRDTPMLIRT